MREGWTKEGKIVLMFVQNDEKEVGLKYKNEAGVKLFSRQLKQYM